MAQRLLGKRIAALVDHGFEQVELTEPKKAEARSARGPREESEASSAAARASGGGAPRAVKNVHHRVTTSAAALALAGVASASGAAFGYVQVPGGAPVATARVVRSFPHDRRAFTQGLEYADGFLYEGTGLSGRSSIRKVRLETGEVVQKRRVPDEYFGEGITIWHSKLIELTWQSHVALVYDRVSFKPIGTFTYPGEGWGLTHDGSSLIMSDGSESLRVLDPDTFGERRRLTVTDRGLPIRNLNEVEYVKGEIYANIWQTDFIARIAPDTGRVLGWVDLRGLLSARERADADVLNGIAYDAAHDRLFVTGKLWPKLFEIAIAK